MSKWITNIQWFQKQRGFQRFLLDRRGGGNLVEKNGKGTFLKSQVDFIQNGFLLDMPLETTDEEDVKAISKSLFGFSTSECISELWKNMPSRCRDWVILVHDITEVDMIADPGFQLQICVPMLAVWLWENHSPSLSLYKIRGKDNMFAKGCTIRLFSMLLVLLGLIE